MSSGKPRQVHTNGTTDKHQETEANLSFFCSVKSAFLRVFTAFCTRQMSWRRKFWLTTKEFTDEKKIKYSHNNTEWMMRKVVLVQTVVVFTVRLISKSEKTFPRGRRRAARSSHDLWRQRARFWLKPFGSESFKPFSASLLATWIQKQTWVGV